MNDQTLIDAAKALIDIADYRFNLTVGRGKKVLNFSISASEQEATHICGLDHLQYIKTSTGNKTSAKTSIIKKIAKGNLRYSSFPTDDKDDLKREIPKTFNPLTKKPYTLEDRIEIIKDIETFLDNAYKGKFYDWQNSFKGIETPDKKTRYVSIKADYLLEIPTGNLNENFYLFLYCDQNNPNHLKIYSAFSDGVNLSKNQSGPYTILSEEKVNTKKRLSTHLYTLPGFGNPELMKITFNNPSVGQISLNSNGAAVLTSPLSPRPTFGQAISSFLKGIASKVKEIVERLLRKPDQDTAGTDDTNRGSGNSLRDSAPRQADTTSPKSETHELRDNDAPKMEQSQKPLVKTAAAPRKSFSQGLDELAKRPRAQGSPKPPVQNIANKKHHKD